MVFVQNGHPAMVRVMEIPSLKIVHEFEIPASKGVHGQFRNARLSSRGTLLVCHMSQGYVAEYSVQGNELYRWEMPGAWSVTELAKENLLFVGKGNTVKEITRISPIRRQWLLIDYLLIEYGAGHEAEVQPVNEEAFLQEIKKRQDDHEER